MTVKYKNRITPFGLQEIEAIAKVLADTNTGLSGSELKHLLASLRIPDTDPGITKWQRLSNAFINFQNKHNVGNHIIFFITKAMDPVSYTDKPDIFQIRKDGLNKVLSLSGYTVGDDGKVRRVSKAKTLDEALSRANRLKAILRKRKVHQNVLSYCEAEILQQNYFHAVFEAMKSISAKVRQLSGLDEDTAELVDRAFGLGKDENPILAINSLDTKTLKSEQRGFINLLKGLYCTFRNPPAHEPKIEWDMTEQDAVDILTMISFIHRKLDKTKKSTPPIT